MSSTRTVFKRRQCLRCDRACVSEGPDHRLCQRCKEFLAETDVGPNPSAVHLRHAQMSR